jgi:hypothetical protein
MVDIVPGTASPPPSPERLAHLQDFFGQRFPAAYVDFLARANGAKPARNEVTGGGRPFVIERFLPILDDYKSDERNGWADVAVVSSQLDARLATDPDDTRIDVVPIAALFAGDFLVLDYRGARGEPSVGVWDHEASDDFAPVVTPVADSFSSFEKLIAER